MIFNTPAIWQRVSQTDVYGQPVYPTGVPIMVSVSKFVEISNKTPLRSYEAASRGRIDEDEDKATILVPPDTAIQINDLITIYNVELVVGGVWPRTNIAGKVKYIQLTLTRQS